MASQESWNKMKQHPDPAEEIQDILKIVESLHDKIVTAPQKDAVLIKSKSLSPNLTGGETRDLQNPATDQDESERYIPKLRRNLRLLKEDVKKLQDLRIEVAIEVGKHMTPLDKLLEKLEKDTTKTNLTKGMKKDLEDINKKIFNLMCQVPLLPNKRKKAGESDSEDVYIDNNGKGIVCLPAIHEMSEELKRLAVFRDVQEKFMKLDSDVKKICLLSFAVFPENQEVNRTMLMYWWIGEGLLAHKALGKGDGILPEDEKPEYVVKKILEEFMDEKLIHAVENKRKEKPSSYKMPPFVHSSVVLISKEIGLFDIYHPGKKPTMNQSRLHKVCLVEESSSQPEAKAKKMQNAVEIETVFNVSERFPDFAFKWFSEDLPSGKKKFGPLSKPMYKDLKVFYLGRWERTAKRHIEVENPELMKYLKHMRKLKLLSFQGISRIERLDDAVCKLNELIILDLRACYNLEKLPDKIDSLKKLMYLDVTDCYMIDRMPKRLSWLDNLEVLKGFVVSDATDEETVCTLAELVHLKKLRKLSITINKGDFGVDQLIDAIKYFTKLEKLKVAWGGINEHKKEAVSAGPVQRFFERTATLILKPEAAGKAELPKPQKNQKPRKLPDTLTKLDLQCFPDEYLPTWLEPNKLINLEKLYIKGGRELLGFGKSLPEKPTDCKVKVLRLKFLPRLKVEWRELKEVYFPELKFLDKYQSPQVSFCPCDGIGIWREKTSMN